MAREVGFDQLMEQLRAVVAKLERGDLSLEEALAAYEQGVALAKKGAQVLDSAEKRVEVLAASEAALERATPRGADAAQTDTEDDA